MDNFGEMNIDDSAPQLQMIWPKRLVSKQPEILLAKGYDLRTYCSGDEERWYKLMDLAGWPGWDVKMLEPWKARILPKSWFMIISKENQNIVSSAMGLHEHTDLHPFGAQLGWVACDPAHTGLKLGMAVCAAVTSRMISMGYDDIHLGTEDFRLPALKTYLRLGYAPFIYSPGMSKRWERIYSKLAWPIERRDWIYAGGGN